MKWREMLKRGIYKDIDLLDRRVKKGIPSSMRIKVWPELMKSPKFKTFSKSLKYINLLAK